MNELTTTYEWKEIPWRKLEVSVFKLQKRIYKASQSGDVRRVHRLQRLLTKSRAAKLLAVRRVTQDNRGKNTAGVDGIKSLTPKQRLVLARDLGALPIGRPTRRVWIPKPGKDEKRPLGIPTMHDRALQALVKLVMEPEWEAKFEPNSYGFRPGRSIHDAIGAIYIAINKKPKYVLDADIAKCFDRIDQESLLCKIGTYPKLRRLIRKWLKAGVLDNGVFAETKAGTPQGGVLSPLLANIALHGLEEHIDAQFPERIRENQQGKRTSVCWKPKVIRYADDFVVLHRDRVVIEQCQRLAQEWLRSIGLEMSQTKTRIAHTFIKEGGKAGFTFLGFDIRQYEASKYSTRQGFKTLIKPSKDAISRHKHQVGDRIDRNKATKQDNLIRLLNPKIGGWRNSYRAVVSKKVYQEIDHFIYVKLRRWAKRRHPRKSTHWTSSKYWRMDQGKRWVFSTKDGLELIRHSNVPIKRHVKVKGKASPFDGNWSYWATRRGTYPGTPCRIATLLKMQKGKCKACELYFTPDTPIDVHHLNGNHHDNKYVNLAAVHCHCHDQIHGGQGELSRRLGARDKGQAAEEPCVAKVTCTVL